MKIPRSGINIISSDDRAVSNVVGVLLVTLLVVLLIGGITAAVLDSSGELGQNDPLVDFQYEVTNDTINITHAGGDPIGLNDTVVVFEGTDGNETRFVMAGNATVTGDGDDDFEVGEEASNGHPVRENAWVEITIIHRPSNQIVSDTPNQFRVPS